MKWQVVSEEYLDYLRIKETRIPRSDYGKNKMKPFFGALFSRGDIIYLSQVSSPKERHKTMKSSQDFLKIYDPKTPNKLISVINLNYMFPVPKDETSILNYGDISKYRSFTTDQERDKYIILLDKELSQINKLALEEKSKKLYYNKCEYPDSVISKRCFDFKKLELYAHEWIIESSKREAAATTEDNA